MKVDIMSDGKDTIIASANSEVTEAIISIHNKSIFENERSRAM